MQNGKTFELQVEFLLVLDAFEMFYCINLKAENALNFL